VVTVTIILKTGGDMSRRHCHLKTHYFQQALQSALTA